MAAQFPELAGQEVAELAAGWDHQLFCVGGAWIFRFPRRADAADHDPASVPKHLSWVTHAFG